MVEESEELERSETSYREGFGNQIEHLKRSALEHIRSRSSEEDRRALLQSLRCKHEQISKGKKTESVEQLTKSIENQIKRIKEDVAEENKILELLEAAKEN
uniref:Uncharacterized protein n=1 Tax=Ditylenchus dipsaci TaxID=166011 RepID=A0A915E1B7_9BILA